VYGTFINLRQTGRPGGESAVLESAARKLGLTILFADVRTPSDIEGAFATMTRSRAGAFLILGGSLPPSGWLAVPDVPKYGSCRKLCLLLTSGCPNVLGRSSWKS
jgi:hypothetical protein